jgi:hypothetical protein
MTIARIGTTKEARSRFNDGEFFRVDCLCNRDIDREIVTKADFDEGEYAEVHFRNKSGFEQSVSIKVVK